MPPTDAIFLLGEGRDHPLHVGGLHLYKPPADASPDYVMDLYNAAIVEGDVTPALRRRAVGALGMYAWQDDADLDLSYHLRHSALPHPGRVRELLTLVSRLHGTQLARSRPLWEAHLIEGLADGRFATYTKIHHALMDGVTAMRLLNSLSTDPDARGMKMPYATRPGRSGSRSREPGGLATRARSTLTDGLEGVSGALGATGAALQSLVRSFDDQATAVPFKAPPSPLNVPITGARRFAADSWSLQRMHAVGKSLGGTINDVVLAMCAGALRRYLDGMGGLPDDPLVAMVPVSLRKDDQGSSGNAVGVILCNLGTHLANPLERFRLIHESAEKGKLQLEGLNQVGVLALSALSFGGLSLGPLFRFPPLRRAPFNIVISNVPGPRKPLYWNGAELEGAYPCSIPIHGQALNITCASYVDRMGFGLTGAREAVPHLQRLLEHLEESLVELEAAA